MSGKENVLPLDSGTADVNHKTRMRIIGTYVAIIKNASRQCVEVNTSGRLCVSDGMNSPN